MRSVSMLIEQARILRSLATTFDECVIREDLRKLAEKCEALAKSVQASAEPDEGSDLA